MRADRIVIAVALAAWLGASSAARAQLFGNRTVGQGISPPRGRQTAAGQRSFASQLFGRQLSGSGSSVFGLARDEMHARGIAEEMALLRGMPVWSEVVKTLPDGVMVAHGPLEA